jgi:predicted TIM-barrel fold metal-dependent hydrolase
MWDHSDELQALNALHLSAEEMDLILYQNAEHVFGKITA